MYSNKSEKSDGGDNDPTDEHFTKSQILNFVDSVETLNVVVERPVAGWKSINQIDKESVSLPSEGTKGLALIINIVEFDNDITNISRRYGSEHDVEYLTDLLIQLDYKLYPSAPNIRERKKKSKQVIKSQIESFKNVCTQQKPASIIVFIGSHGRHPNQIVTSDRQWMDIYEDIIYQFTQDKNFTVLEGKPKIFLVQACQSYSPNSGSVVTSQASFHQEPNHINDDVYICTATTPGKVSKRDIYKGSWFPYCFTYMMMKHALKMKSLQEIMDLVKNKMDEIKDYQEFKQIPSFISGNNSKPLYFVGSDYSSSGIRNYDANISWMEGVSKFCIICTIDKQITCDKLTENFRECSILIHEWKDFPEFLLSDRCKLEEHVVDVVTDCTLKHFKLCLRKLDKIKRHRIIFITDLDKQEILKLNSAKYKVDVLVDPMSFQDLSLAYQFKIVERLERKYGISLSEDELKGELLVDILTGRGMFHDEIKPRLIGYYVPRKVLTRNIISDELFAKKYPNDIFLFRGIQRSHLSAVVKNQMTGRSRDQLERIEDLHFLTLDDDSHYDIICQNTTKSVHILNYENGKLRWVQTKGNIRTVQEHVSKEQEEQMEESFCSLICANSGAPVCISDSPGMGKTILLAQIGKRLRRMFPDRTVLFVELSSFIQRVAHATKITDGIDPKIIVMALQDTVCKTLLGRHILESKIKSNEVTIELLLDGFDEVEYNDSDFAHGILKTIRKSFTSVRMWVASRPHKVIELEETLVGLGFNIKPFQLVDQVNFLTRFWSRNTKLNNQRLVEFACHCLKSLKGKISSSQQDIAGIPLQCLLIGEVYERRAVEHAKIGASSPLPEQFVISSITTLYQEVIKKKIAKYGSTYGAQESTVESDTRRGLILNWLRILGWQKEAPLPQGKKLSDEILNDLHGHLGLHLIFPDVFRKLKLSFGQQEICAVLNVGVWELSGGTEPKVLHRTFAEYFVALFIRDRLMSGNGWGKVMAKFLMQTLFQVKANKDNVPEFPYPVVIHFLNSLLTLSTNSTDSIAIPSKVVKDIKCHIPNKPLLSQLVYALAYADYVNILKLFDNIGEFRKPTTASSIFDNRFISCAIYHSGVELIRLAFLHFEQHHQEQFDSVMKGKLLRLAVQRGDVAPVEFLINEKGLRTMVEKLHEDGTKTLLHHCLYKTMDNTEAEIDQRIEILRMLNGINQTLMEERDQDGCTPLLVWHSHVRLRLELICLGVDVTAQDNNEETILHGWQGFNRNDYHTIAKKIQEMGRLEEMVHFKSSVGKTPLLSILKLSDPLPETLKMFAEARADFNYISATEWASLTYAVFYNRSLSTLQTLIQLGADKCCRNRSGDTLLHVAAYNWTQSVPTLEFLARDHGMDVNAKNDHQETPLDIVLEMRYGYEGKEVFEMGLVIFELGGRPNTSKDAINKWTSWDMFDWDGKWIDTGGGMGNESFVEDRVRMDRVSSAWRGFLVRGGGFEGDELFPDYREMKPLYVDILLLHIYLFGEESVESGTCGMTSPSPHPLNYPYLKALLLKKGAKDRSYGAMGRLTQILRRTVERTTPIWDQETINKFMAEELI